jgi:hypothetical protein
MKERGEGREEKGERGAEERRKKVNIIFLYMRVVRQQHHHHHHHHLEETYPNIQESKLKTFEFPSAFFWGGDDQNTN